MKTVTRLRASFSRLRSRAHWDAIAQLPIHQAYRSLNGIFIHIPKTAGLAFSQALFKAESQHRAPYQYRLIFGNKFYESAFKFAIVRDPVTRFVSAYRFLKAGGINAADRAFRLRHDKSFDNMEVFVDSFLSTEAIQKYLHFQKQKDFLCDLDGSLAADYVGSFEDISASYAYISRRLGVDTSLPVVNKKTYDPGDIEELSHAQVIALKRFYAEDYLLIDAKPGKGM